MYPLVQIEFSSSCEEESLAKFEAKDDESSSYTSDEVAIVFKETPQFQCNCQTEPLEEPSTSTGQTISSVPSEITQMEKQMETWDFEMSVKRTIKGKRIHFQLSQNGIHLFHSKLKSRHQILFRKPIGVSAGSESHFSQTDFAGVVHCEGKYRFVLVQNNKEVMTVEFKPVKGPYPKDIFVTLSDPKMQLVNCKPTLNAENHWTLYLGGKEAIPSVKNCALINIEDPKESVLFMRRISQTECKIDSNGALPPICLFTFALCSFVSAI